MCSVTESKNMTKQIDWRVADTATTAIFHLTGNAQSERKFNADANDIVRKRI